MAQPRQRPAPTPVKRKRIRARRLQRSAASEVTVLELGKYELELALPGVKILKKANNKKRIDVSKLLKGYAAASRKAAQAGQSIEYTFRVSPDGEAKPVTEADPLEAALAAARKRGHEKVSDILKGDDMLTARQFGELIGTSHETVNVRRKRGEILGLQGATRVIKYPSWQVTNAGTVVPALAQLSEVLGNRPWTVYRFLRTAHSELGGQTALDALKAGQEENVLNVARNQNNGVFT